MKHWPLHLLWQQTQELMLAGVTQLNAKLRGISGEKLVMRVLELWQFFFGTVLPYFQGAFLPLQIELRSNANQLDNASIRVELLATFRDHLVLPRIDRLQEAFQKVCLDVEEMRKAPDTIPKAIQMLAVLTEVNDERRAMVETALSRLKSDMQRYGRALYGNSK